jgi:nicotinamidase/pyrazinamidase
VRSVFIDVDTQHDFCAPSGALYVPGADALHGNFVALFALATEHEAPIVSSVDSHAFDAWEFEGAPSTGPRGERPNFPPHCVKGSAGWLKLPGTLAPRVRFLPNVPLRHDELKAAVRANRPQQIVLEKEVYSLFANPNAELVLDELTGGGGPTRFFVFGVALDYCVKAAALGLEDWLGRRNRDGEVWLIEDATAAVDGSVTEKTLRALGEAHIKIRTMNDVHRVVTREADTRAAVNAPSQSRLMAAPLLAPPRPR